MWSGDALHGGRFHLGRRAVTSALMAWSVVPVRAANNVEVGDESITITVLIDVFGADDELINRWGPAITAAWNAGPDGKPFTYCGREVIITVDMRSVAPGDAGRTDAHVIAPRRLRPGQYFISHVNYGQPGNSYRPAEENVSGEWRRCGLCVGGSGPFEEIVVAHEFGHLLGLRDEYRWIASKHDRNNNGKRDPGEPTEPDTDRFDDAFDSIMAWKNGRVLQRHINRVMERHGANEGLKCLRIVHSVETNGSDGAGGFRRLTGDFDISVEIGDLGRLTGRGTGSGTIEILDPDCFRGEGSTSFEFAVQGTRLDDFVLVTFDPNLRVPYEVETFGRCAGQDFSPEEASPIPYVAAISGELVNGRFEETIAESDGSIVLYTLIEEE